MNSGSIESEQIRSFAFEQLRPKPGPIHTVVMDLDGCVYCSDELNHQVFSIDSQGELRWQAFKKEAEPSLFHYPRGIALGWISPDGLPIQCLGVADSWHRRILFMDLHDGGIISSLDADLDGPFREPTDIRFISSTWAGANDAPSGYWLVLDQSKHRLTSYDLAGKPFGNWGRCVDPYTAAKWAATGTFPNLEKMDSCSLPPVCYDIL
jgi:hypothetical protein